MIENEVAEALVSLSESRSYFFQHLDMLDNALRSQIVQLFLTNETMYLSLLRASTQFTTQISIPFSSLFNLYNQEPPLEPVIVTATQAEINRALVSRTDFSTPPTCSICQDTITSTECIELRDCYHVYHRACINEWFTRSVLCPVCRRDIRESNPPSQTSSDEE